jgi:hypothetical protein
LQGENGFWVLGSGFWVQGFRVSGFRFQGFQGYNVIAGRYDEAKGVSTPEVYSKT